MWAVLKALLATKAVKTAGGVVGGGGAAVVLLVSLVDTRVASVRIETERYVDLKHDTVMTKIDSVQDGQTDIKKMLIVIDSRLYNLNKEKSK